MTGDPEPIISSRDLFIGGYTEIMNLLTLERPGGYGVYDEFYAT